MSRLRRFEWPVTVFGSAVLVAWLILAVDAAARRAWDDVRIAAHTEAAILIYGVAGTIAGLTLALGAALARALSRALEQRQPRLAHHAPAVLAGLAGGAASAKTAFWTFTGHGIAGSGVARIGPFVLVAAAGIGAAVTAHVTLWAVREATGGRRTPAAIVSGALFSVAALAVLVDLTVYVSLYSRLHTVVEAVAALCVFAALMPIAAWLGTWAPRARFALGTAFMAAGLLVSATYAASPSARAWTEETLRHVWREPVYLGRMLSRVQLAEAFLRDPGSYNDTTANSILRLRQRYDLATTTRSRTWDDPPAEPEWLRNRVIEMRGSAEYNIVIYYVDTLRADVAANPAIMPAVGRFAKTALDFRRTYTTGSNTLHALPGLTGGNYDLVDENQNDLVRVAELGGYRTTLVTAQSAREFLSMLLPAFRFQETVEIADYAAGNEQVWGYGADQPTAERIVSRALEWLLLHRDDRFLLWLFNFDIHNWRELDEAYINATAKTYGVPEAGELAWRYRVAARAVDAQFARLLDGMEDMGLTDRTIVVFVSDHGEALGRDGFWVHSVFLWENLVRVPLLIRVPDIKGRRIDAMVSLVDVAPTLARYIAPNAEMTGYHGEDLLTYLVAERPPRRLPLLLVGTSKEQLVRLGIIDPPKPWKLILPLEGGLPELYNLNAPDPDARDLAAQAPREMLHLLNQLVRAPMFPRLGPDGTGTGGAPGTGDSAAAQK